MSTSEVTGTETGGAGPRFGGRSARPETFTKRLNSEGVRRCSPIDVPMENFAVRPAIVLDPIDRVIYQALVDRLYPTAGQTPDARSTARLPRRLHASA